MTAFDRFMAEWIWKLRKVAVKRARIRLEPSVMAIDARGRRKVSPPGLSKWSQAHLDFWFPKDK